MTLVPLFAPATPIHREMAICDAWASVFSSPFSLAAWVMY